MWLKPTRTHVSLQTCGPIGTESLIKSLMPSIKSEVGSEFLGNLDKNEKKPFVQKKKVFPLTADRMGIY